MQLYEMELDGNLTFSVGQYKIWTADCGLRTMDCGLGIKHGLGRKCGLRTEYKTRARYKTRTTNCVYKTALER